jgi:hypothetical protein
MHLVRHLTEAAAVRGLRFDPAIRRKNLPPARTPNPLAVFARRIK